MKTHHKIIALFGALAGIIVGGLFGLAVSTLLKIIVGFGLLAIGFYGESMPLTATYFAALFIGFCILLYMAGVGFHRVIQWVTTKIENKEMTNG